jgi:hypothetical protein
MGTKVMKLTIDLVPESTWDKNVRTMVSQKRWDEIRKKVYVAADHKCEICGAAPKRLECHELWEYDDKNHIQKLIKLLALCWHCHAIQHLGHTQILAEQGRCDINEVLEHFCAVNNCTSEDFIEYKEKQFKVWKKRSQHSWELDVSLLKTL